MTWDDICPKVLADCGRCCCLCRRFKPIRLQVHHIVPRSEGGKDELANAIALCLTCHTDVHTQVRFTRRFTVEELKMHRDNVCRLVAEGKLPAGEDTGSMFDELSVPVAEAISRPDLIPAAIRVLVAAASSDGQILVTQTSSGNTVQVGRENLIEEPKNPRIVAEYQHAIEQLEQYELIEARGYKPEIFEVTHTGYLFADELQAGEGHIPCE